MNTSKQTALRMLIIKAVVLMSFLGGACTPANSQKAAMARLNAQQAADFQTALDELARQGGVALVAEGVPQYPLSPEAAAKMTAPMPLDSAVEAVAGAYGYTAQRDGEVFTLKKRYSAADDLPALTPAECEHAVAQLGQTAEPFNPHIPHDYAIKYDDGRPHGRSYKIVSPLIASFAASLTSAQRDAMHQNRLRFSSLSVEQQRLVHGMLLYIYVQQPMAVEVRALPLLETALAGATFVRQAVGATQNVFGYLLPKAPGGPALFHPLGKFNGHDGLDGLSFSPTAPAAPGADPTAPTASSADTNGAFPETLSQAVAGLGVDPHDAAHLHVSVDEAVAAKPVTVAGTANAPADQVVKALADVYGLRLADEGAGDKSDTFLTLTTVPPPADFSGLAAAMRRALPEPFRRAAHLEQMVDAERGLRAIIDQVEDRNGARPSTPRPSNVEETPAELEQAERERKIAMDGMRQLDSMSDQAGQADLALDRLFVASVRRLRALAEPQLAASPGGLPVSALSEGGRDAFATMLLVEATQSIVKLLTQPAAEEIISQQRLVLSGGVSGGPDDPKFSVMFCLPNANGFMVQKCGIIGKEYDR